MAVSHEQIARLKNEIATLTFDVNRATDRYAMDMVMDFLDLCDLDYVEEMARAIEILNQSTIAAIIEVEDDDAVQVDVR